MKCILRSANRQAYTYLPWSQILKLTTVVSFLILKAAIISDNLFPP